MVRLRHIFEVTMVTKYFSHFVHCITEHEDAGPEEVVPTLCGQLTRRAVVCSYVTFDYANDQDIKIAWCDTCVLMNLARKSNEAYTSDT